jgi:PIN domain nuclease of toxin-antitoxin system
MMEEAPEKVLVPSVCIWEICLAHQKGRLGFTFEDVREGINRMVNSPGFRAVDLTPEMAISARLLEFRHEDPADRFIAATAHVLGVPLATADPKLHNLPWLKTIQ